MKILITLAMLGLFAGACDRTANEAEIQREEESIIYDDAGYKVNDGSTFESDDSEIQREEADLGTDMGSDVEYEESELEDDEVIDDSIRQVEE